MVLVGMILLVIGARMGLGAGGYHRTIQDGKYTDKFIRLATIHKASNYPYEWLMRMICVWMGGVALALEIGLVMLLAMALPVISAGTPTSTPSSRRHKTEATLMWALDVGRFAGEFFMNRRLKIRFKNTCFVC